MRIAMIGGGYVGLVSGGCFAEFGTDVTVVEVDAEKLAALQRRPHADLRAWPRKAGGGECRRRPARVHRAISPPRCTTPRRCSSRSARRPAAATATPTSDLRLRRRRAGGPRAHRLCRHRHQIHRPGRHQPPRSRRSSAPRARTSTSTSPPIRSSCARATPSATSCARTAW